MAAWAKMAEAGHHSKDWVSTKLTLDVWGTQRHWYNCYVIIPVEYHFYMGFNINTTLRSETLAWVFISLHLCSCSSAYVPISMWPMSWSTCVSMSTCVQSVCAWVFGLSPYLMVFARKEKSMSHLPMAPCSLFSLPASCDPLPCSGRLLVSSWPPG